MKLRLQSDKWDYGTVGEPVRVEGKNYMVGDVVKIRMSNGDKTLHIVVNKEDEYTDKRVSFFMGLGSGLMPDERVIGIVNHCEELNVGDVHNRVVVCEQ